MRELVHLLFFFLFFLLFFFFLLGFNATFWQIDLIAFQFSYFISRKLLLQGTIHFFCNLRGGFQVIFGKTFAYQEIDNGILTNIKFFGRA